MSTKYYPPLSDLIDASSIPGNISFIENNVQLVSDTLLSKIFYKNLAADVSPKGDIAHYSLTLLNKSLRIPVFGLGMNIVLFDGSQTNFSEFPIILNWEWRLQKYFSEFEIQGFSYAPQAFVDVFLEMIEVENVEEFFGEIANTFLDDGNDAYLNFYTEVSSSINTYRDSSTAVDTEIQNILDQLTIIKDEVFSLVNNTNLFTIKAIYDNYNNNTKIKPAVDSIKNSIETLRDTFDIDINIYKDAIVAALNEFNDLNEKFNRLLKLIQCWLADITLEDLENLLIPQFSLELTDIKMALEFPRKWLLPLDNVTTSSTYGQPLDEDSAIPEEQKRKSKLTFTAGSLKYATQTGFKFKKENTFGFEKSMIGKSGLTIEINNMKLDLSRKTNIPEAIADNRPADFMGVYAQDAVIGLPAKWFEQDNGTTLGIFGRNLLIGTGGISGKIGLEAMGAPGQPPPANAEMIFTLGKKDGSNQRKGFKIGFQHFHMVWQQNSLIESSVKGSLTIPKFKRCDASGNPISGPLRIEIEALFEQDGDFQITAKPTGGLSLCLENAFIVTIDGLEVGKDDDKVFLCISGKLRFDNNTILKDLIKDPIEVKKLCIYSDGSFEIGGGSIPLPESAKLKIGPTEVFITNLTFGSEEREHKGVLRKYKFFGFDCGVSAGTIGLDLRGDGIAFYFSTDDHPDGKHRFLKIAGIGIDLVIPGSASKETAAVLIQGYLSLKEEEYRGSIAFQLPKAKIAGGASMAMKPKVPAWVVDAFLELSVPIPLGPSGLGIYGFRGLFGFRYVAAKEAIGLTQDDKWFDYYKKDVPPGGKGVHTGKMYTPERTEGAKNPISIGAGLSLATTSDDGKAFSLQAFFLISLPELIFIQGKANILGDRVGLIKGEPPFFAFVAFSPGHSVEFGLGADYKQRESGKLLALNAEVEAGFFMKNNSAWYLNFGTKEKPITARILSLFNAYSYLMLSASGIEAGAGVEFGFNKKYGPVKASVGVYLDIWGTLSFEGAQIGAGIALGGYVDVSIWGIGLSISIATTLEATVPKPFRIAGSVEVCVSVKVLIKKFSKCFDVKFVWEKDNSLETTPIPVLPVNANSPKGSPVSALHIGSGKTYEINYFGNSSIPANANGINKIVPLDSYIDIQFEKALDANAVSARIGGVSNGPKGHQDLIPPKPAYNRVTHTYKVNAVNLMVWNGGGWADYHPYEALTIGSSSNLGVNVTDLKLGFFQKTGKEYNKIRFLAQTPFSYMETSAGGYTPEQMGITSSTLFCKETLRKWHCVRWDGDTIFNKNKWYHHQEITFVIKKMDGQVIGFYNAFQIPNSLWIPKEASLEITFPEPSISTRIKLFSFSPSVTIKYFEADYQFGFVQYNEVSSVQKSGFDFFQAINYHDASHPIRKIIIEPMVIDIGFVQQLEIEIDLLQQSIYVGSDPTMNVEEAMLLLEQKKLELEKLKEVGCNNDPNGYPNIPWIKDEIKKCQDELKDCQDKLEDLEDNLEKECGKAEDLQNNIGECLLKIEKVIDQPSILGCILQIRKQLKKNKKLDNNLNVLIKQLTNTLKNCDKKINEQLMAFYQALSIMLSDCHKKCESIKEEIKTVKDHCNEIEEKIDKLEDFLNGSGIDPNGNPIPNDEPSCGTYIQEVCWMTEEDHLYNQSIPAQDAIEEDFQLAQAAIENIISPIWRPNEKYLVEVKFSDTVNGTTTPSTVYFGFQTEGPIGHFNELNIPELNKFTGTNNNPNFDGKVEVPETALKFYIDNPRSYPDPTGKILGRKPLYFKAPRILLYYLKPYVYHFFGTWDNYKGLPTRTGALEMLIKDPVEDMSDPASLDHTSAVFTLFPITQVTWDDDNDPIIPEDIQVYGALRNPEINNPSFPGVTCWTTGGDPIIPASKNTEIIPQNLKPLKLYTAIVKNNFEGNSKEIHRYVFQTSRFGSIQEHVNSYHLEDKEGNVRDAIFTIDLNLERVGSSAQTNINRAFNIVLNNPNNLNNYNKTLAATFADPFQRLMEGHLKIKSLHPPSGIEFNWIHETKKNRMIGIYINSVEPLNDPKIPLSDLQNSVKVLENGISVQDYFSLFSKDRSKVVLMNVGKNITASDIRIRFAYLEWNGQQYTEHSHVTTDNIILT